MAGRDPRRERLVRVAVGGDAIEAELLHGILANAGIKVLVKNTDALSAYSGGGVARSVELFVLEGDAGAARAILGDGADMGERP